MNNDLNIPSRGALDLVSLGALVHRLDPGIVPFRKATVCQIHVSGGEFNVAANLSDCFRMNTGIATAMVDYPIGDLVAERVKAMGVEPFYKRFEHNGANGPNMAAVYSDRGHGVRAPVVFYNRLNDGQAQARAWYTLRHIAGPVEFIENIPTFGERNADTIISDLQDNLTVLIRCTYLDLTSLR